MHSAARGVWSAQSVVAALLCSGHAIVSAGMIAYCGPFTAAYRTELEATWFAKLREANIPHTPGCNLKQFLGTEKGTAVFLPRQLSE